MSTQRLFHWALSSAMRAGEAWPLPARLDGRSSPHLVKEFSIGLREVR